MKYLIMIEPTATGFSAYSPDLPGCVSTGATRDECEANMREAIEFYIDGLRQEGGAGRAFIMWLCDSTFSSVEHLNGDGHAFAEAYYDKYLADFQAIFQVEYETIYHVSYSCANRRRVAIRLDERYELWRSGGTGQLKAKE